jgi:carbamoyltransferase
MRVLGLGTEGDAGAAVVENGRILAAINEERLSRLKMVMGFPRASIGEALRLSGTSIRDLDAVLIGGTHDLFVDHLEPFEGWFQHVASGPGGLVKRLAGRLARYRDTIPGLEAAYYAALAPSFWRRRHSLVRLLRNELGVRCPIRFVDHHFSHIASAYFTSGFRDALVISLDGGGDARSSLVYAVRGGRFEYLHESSAFNSLGNYYAYVTHLCGFKAMRHEGKITGLAAHGEPRYVPLLRQFIEEDNGQLINRGRVAHLGAIRELDRRLPKGWAREDLAASIQRHFEDVARRYVGHWVRVSGLTDLALAGGVVANVRVNEELHDLPGVQRIFVHPHMGDGGLSVGAALSACADGVLDRTMPAHLEPLRDVYLGTELLPGEIAKALAAYDLKPEAIARPIEEQIADLLQSGYVVARAAGRMEYGPRALGNRSILYQPTDRKVNDWLNQNLRRTEFMPFAPATLYEARDRAFLRVSGAEHAAEFMTITFHGSPWTLAHMKGVVHLDDTARPQLVRRDRNPGFYRIIEAFQQRTGLPAVINTSFNMHEEPIVCTADDCVRAFLDGNIDYLAIGDFLVRQPKGITHALEQVESVREIVPAR